MPRYGRITVRHRIAKGVYQTTSYTPEEYAEYQQQQRSAGLGCLVLTAILIFAGVQCSGTPQSAKRSNFASEVGQSSVSAAPVHHRKRKHRAASSSSMAQPTSADSQPQLVDCQAITKESPTAENIARYNSCIQQNGAPSWVQKPEQAAPVDAAPRSEP